MTVSVKCQIEIKINNYNNIVVNIYIAMTEQEKKLF